MPQSATAATKRGGDLSIDGSNETKVPQRQSYPEENLSSVPPIETPPGTDRSNQAEDAAEAVPRPGTAARRPRFAKGGPRYYDLNQHELITMLDEVDDERSRARFREAVYISVIVWLILGWVMVYGPRYLWHAPVLVTALPEKSNEMTYLDVPPDVRKQLQRTRPAPNVSTQSTESQSPKPSPQAPQPRAGTPTPPAPKPAPQPAQQPRQAPQQQSAPPQQQQQQPQQPQQEARNTPPTPQPPRSQPLADSPTPSPTPNRNIFGSQGSASQQIQQAARSARGGEGGDYGSTGGGKTGGSKLGTQIISDTQGVDFGKYLQRLLSDVRRNWLPLIPEECRPPLNKQGITGVRFTIQPNGTISAMHLDYSTHDVAIDRAAWGSITGLGAAQPLPKEFHGPNLELRIEFRINKDGQGAE